MTKTKKTPPGGGAKTDTAEGVVTDDQGHDRADTPSAQDAAGELVPQVECWDDSALILIYEGGIGREAEALAIVDEHLFGDALCRTGILQTPPQGFFLCCVDPNPTQNCGFVASIGRHRLADLLHIYGIALWSLMTPPNPPFTLRSALGLKERPMMLRCNAIDTITRVSPSVLASLKQAFQDFEGSIGYEG